ncbi:MAG: TrkA family potassium uptake protein [Erysipelotrichaceae bacterium]
MEQKQYAVLGLGIFGSTIAKTLSEYGCDVIAIDKDIENVERVAGFATTAIQADFTDIEQLRDIGFGDVDVAVVATGSKLEASIIAITNLKELGVPYILAKAKNKIYMQILLKVGADRVIRPEKEMGEQIAKSLLSRNIVEVIELDNKYSVVELVTPKKWIGYDLKSIDVRRKYGMNIIACKKQGSDEFSFAPGPDYVMEKGDHILVVAEHTVFEQNEYLGKL